MTTENHLIRYFRECYRSDNRQSNLLDFTSRKVEQQLYFEDKEELIRGHLPFVSIELEKAVAISKTLQLYSKEKELIYGSFFIGGYTKDNMGKKKKVFAPLFYYPAIVEIKEDEGYLRINTNERCLNVPLLNLFLQEDINKFIEDPLYTDLPPDFIPFESISGLKKLLEKHLINTNTAALLSYPTLQSLKEAKKTLKKLSTSASTFPCIIPISSCGILEKSQDTRGVLNELKNLSEAQQFSDALKALLNPNIPNNKSTEPQLSSLPMLLSYAQQELLKSAANNPLTMIVGPPGTGKTYTICSIATEHMIRGQSVLIASRTDEAVDVIRNKIGTLLGTEKILVRGGRKRSYSTPLRRFLKSLLTRKKLLDFLKKGFGIQATINEKNLTILQKKIDSNSKTLLKLSKRFEKEIEESIEKSKILAEKDKSFSDKVKTVYWKLKNKMDSPLWELSDKLNLLEKEQKELVNQFIKINYILQLTQVLESDWSAIKSFYNAIKESNDTQREQLFKAVNFRPVFKAFPLWLSKISEIKNVLPFETEMVDLVIIDEATQCDIASCLPLIQRAKRVVFAGDPEQLRHISFLSDSIQKLFQQKFELTHLDDNLLNYRTYSILDYVINAISDASQIAALNEHFRSIPPIIAFSNHHFYQNELKIMTAHPDDNEAGLYWVRCNGKRLKNGSNLEEAAAIIKHLEGLIKKEKKLGKSYCTSVGILSPFRGQVELLSQLLLDTFSLETIEKHAIRVGTAYSFQGEERDIMHISFAIDKESHTAAVRHLNKSDVFNVSITRARQAQYIYYSIEQKDLPKQSLLRQYLSFTHQKNHFEPIDYSDTFLANIKTNLKKWGIVSYWQAFHMAGTLVDILVKKEDKYLAIDLIGYPGKLSESFGMERYQILHRAGISCLPISYADWYFDPESCLLKLKQFLKIEPT